MSATRATTSIRIPMPKVNASQAQISSQQEPPAPARATHADMPAGDVDAAGSRLAPDPPRLAEPDAATRRDQLQRTDTGNQPKRKVGRPKKPDGRRATTVYLDVVDDDLIADERKRRRKGGMPLHLVDVATIIRDAIRHTYGPLDTRARREAEERLSANT